MSNAAGLPFSQNSAGGIMSSPGIPTGPMKMGPGPPGPGAGFQTGRPPPQHGGANMPYTSSAMQGMPRSVGPRMGPPPAGMTGIPPPGQTPLPPTSMNYRQPGPPISGGPPPRPQGNPASIPPTTVSGLISSDFPRSNSAPNMPPGARPPQLSGVPQYPPHSGSIAMNGLGQVAPPRMNGPPGGNLIPPIRQPVDLAKSMSQPVMPSASGAPPAHPQMQNAVPSRMPPPHGAMQIPPPGTRFHGPPHPTSTGPVINNMPPSQQGRPSELPVPYHGQAQYSHQIQDNNVITPGMTPGSSEPASQKSSRAPSPIPGQNYDELEGQFMPHHGLIPRSDAGSYSPASHGQTVPPPPLQGQTMPPASHGQAMPPARSQSQMMPPPTSHGQMMPPPPHQGHTMPPPPHQGHTMPPPPYQGHTMPPPYQGQGMPPPTSQGPVMPPPTNQGPVMPPPTSQSVNRSHYPQMQAGYGQPQQPMSYQQPGPQSGPATGVVNDIMNAPAPAYSSANSVQSSNPNALSSGINSLKLDSTRAVNLLQERNLIQANGPESPEATLHQEWKKVNCHQDIFRCTLNTLPNTQSLLSKSRLPLGILIYPFKDLSQLPVIQSSVIVRCRSCRTYINPFVSFVDMRRWKCNLCYRVNDLPEEFNYDPVSKRYGEPQRRPEIRSATIEFIAPSEYMLRPPQPAVYLYVLDVSFNAVETGYLAVFCQTLLDEIDRIPGDSRTQIGFITFDRALHFYNLAEGISQPQMLVVSDVEDIFLPSPDSLLVNLQESKELVCQLLEKLPEMFAKNLETGNALGPALNAAYKLMGGTGGRVSVFQTQLPTVGPGALKNREDPNERAGKRIHNLGPVTDFYKKLSLDCSAQQIAVDLFLLNGQYADIATIACISKYSGGCIHYFPGLHTIKCPGEVERFEGTLRRYITRKIGFESVMRIRCTRGLSIHTFHGNFFVRSTDLLSLPNINPDAGFGMQMSIDDNIESSHCSFQAALLYTSSKGERRIRVHTMCLPVTNQLTEVFAGANQRSIIGLLAKMAVDRALSASLSDAREAMMYAVIDMLSAYGNTLTSAQRLGQLPCPFSLCLMPIYVTAMLKYIAFRVGASTKLDDRVFALEECKTLPLCYLMMQLYPNLYPVHALDDRNGLSKGDLVIPQPPIVQLCSGNMDRHGAYLMDSGKHMYLWVGASVSDQFCQDILDLPNFQAIPADGIPEMPEVENPASERIRNFINYLIDQRPFPPSFLILREDSPSRFLFLQHMVEDKTESTMSYYEFLQYLQKEIKS